jgi:hypothetical protein
MGGVSGLAFKFWHLLVGHGVIADEWLAIVKEKIGISPHDAYVTRLV